MRRVALSICLTLLAVASPRAQASRAEIEGAMKRATTFMAESVAYRGGYVWTVSEDLTTRWGEVPARPSQIWVQAATPMVGMALLDAYDATRDRYYLDAARRAADALIFGQHPRGGWHYFVDFNPVGLDEWYTTRASQFEYGYEEYRHYYGNATNDDQVTSDAAAFVLRYYTTTLDAAYRGPALKALDFVLEAQYPNGAWPQRYPLRHDFAHDGLPDYTSYYTLNDGVMQGYIELMVAAHRALGDARYFEAARRGVDFLIAVQGPDGEAAWAEQYGPAMTPIAARTHEPAGYVTRESRDVLRLLEMFYLLTGDARYLAPIPRCLAWYDRVNKEAIELTRPPSRYWQPGTNLPVYVVRRGAHNAEGYGLYEWTTTPPAGLDVKAAIDVAPIRAEYARVAALKTPEARAAYFDEQFGRLRRQAPSAAQVESIIKGLDTRGAWVTDGIMVHALTTSGKNPGSQVPVRGISTSVFVRNLSALTSAYAAAAR